MNSVEPVHSANAQGMAIANALIESHFAAHWRFGTGVVFIFSMFTML